MDYVQITDDHRREMLDAIGAPSVADLFSSLDAKYKLDRPLNLPKAQSELELQVSLGELTAANNPAVGHGTACFLSPSPTVVIATRVSASTSVAERRTAPARSIAPIIRSNTSSTTNTSFSAMQSRLLSYAPPAIMQRAA